MRYSFRLSQKYHRLKGSSPRSSQPLSLLASLVRVKLINVNRFTSQLSIAISSQCSSNIQVQWEWSSLHDKMTYFGWKGDKSNRKAFYYNSHLETLYKREAKWAANQQHYRHLLHRVSVAALGSCSLWKAHSAHCLLWVSKRSSSLHLLGIHRDFSFHTCIFKLLHAFLR